MVVVAENLSRPVHEASVAEVLTHLETDAGKGLSETEAACRLRRSGPNVLPLVGVAGPLRRLARQFTDPLIYVLLVAGTLALLLGETVDASVVFAVVLVNAVIGFTQESKAEAALGALRALARTAARVVRDGREQSIGSEDLVPGDLVRIAAGDKVPADLRLVACDGLRVDESILTGESVPVAKGTEAVLPGQAVADRRNIAYSGTLIVGGSATGAVVATGSATELGEIQRLVGSADDLATPLTRKIEHFSKILTVTILALAIVTFVLGVLRGLPAGEMVTAAVALAVGAIPEGLPAAVTITLAIGVSRLARRGAIIRRLPAVETLGATTVICADKTGTLTENRMTVRFVWTPRGRVEFCPAGTVGAIGLRGERGQPVAAGDDAALFACLLTGALCNDASLTNAGDGPVATGDPTEIALLVAADQAAVDHRALAPPRTATIGFTSERQLMATVHEPNAGAGGVVLVKGSIERVLAHCTDQMNADGSMAPLDRGAALTAAEALGREGLRVLATAQRSVDPGTGHDEGELVDSLVFTGLQAMHDPPRPAAARAVQSCLDAGIDVKMITGDHATTAATVAKHIGLFNAGHDGRDGLVLTGAELDALDPGAFASAVAHASVFARVSPEQKLRLVRELQAGDQVVAMTGDGVNDAPALRQADIGVAMGRNGTDVAKDAADLVLTDDDFSTIEAAVEEGRAVFENLRKFIVWTVPTNIAEGLVIFVAILAGTRLPILPVQILWINMTTAVALGLMLAFEPPEPDLMQRPPRDPSLPLLTRAVLGRVLLVSAVLVSGVWWVFQWEQAAGASVAAARTAAMNTFVAAQIIYLFTCRSLTRPTAQLGVFTNRWLLAGVAIQVTSQLALTYLPVMQSVFQTAPIPLVSWFRILAVAAAAGAVTSADKRFRRRAI